MSGESEKTLRDTFEEAAVSTSSHIALQAPSSFFHAVQKLAPCILFIDEIDAITPKRETAQREMERRIVAQLLTCMDDLSWDKTGGKAVMILGATNRPDSLDPALRRAGRFDAEITMGVPDQAGRERILRVLMSKLRLKGDFNYSFLAKSTPGYVGADLSALTGAAGVIAVKRIFEQFGRGEVGDLLLGGGEGEGASIEELLDEEVQGGQQTIIEVEEVDIDGMNIDEETTTTPSIDPTLPPIFSVDNTAPSTGTVTPLIAPIPPLLVPGPFSVLPPSLAALPIATFLQTHPEPLTPHQLLSLSLTNADFTAALQIVQPSSQREGFTTVPSITWSDLGALHTVREEMRMSIVRPIREPEIFEKLGIMNPCGVLLWGPPGCGKTLLAKAVANESGANFISVKGPELLNKVSLSFRIIFIGGRAMLIDFGDESTLENRNERYDRFS